MPLFSDIGAIALFFKHVQAGCPSDEPATSGLSSYAVLGIVLLASGVLLTVFTLVIIWKYLGSGGSCKCKAEVEEDVEELSPPSKAPEVSKVSKELHAPILLPPERRKLHRVLAILGALGLSLDLDTI